MCLVPYFFICSFYEFHFNFFKHKKPFCVIFSFLYSRAVCVVFNIGDSLLTCFLFSYGLDEFLGSSGFPHRDVLKVKYRWAGEEAGIPVGCGNYGW